MSIEKVFVNASTNTIGYLIIGVLNLILMGSIIRSFGLDGYGAFILIRLLTPLGYFNILDFGMFESTVRNIAKYRSSINYVNQVFSISLLYILCVGTLTSLFIFFLGEHLLVFLGLNEALTSGSRPADSWVLFLVIIQIPLFIMFFVESVIKGYEKFLLLRLIDVFVVSGCLILLAFWHDNNIQISDFIFAYYAFLGFKLITLIIILVNSDISFSRFSFSSSVVRNDVFEHSSTLGAGKVISVTVDSIPVIALSGLANIELAGAFDAIMRIPRFIKAVMGATNNVIVPYASALSESDFDQAKASLAISITKYQSMIFAPVLIFGLVFSEQILFVWIGQEYVAYSASMMLCFIVPIMILSIGASGSVAIVNQKILKPLNYINLMRLLIYAVSAYILLKFLTLEAFIYANIFSYVFCVIFTLRVFRSHFDISILRLIKPTLWSVTISAIILIFGLKIILWSGVTNLLFILVAAGCLLIAVWSTLYASGLSSSEKQKFISMVGSKT